METRDIRRHDLMSRVLDGRTVDLDLLEVALGTSEGKEELAALVLARVRRSPIPASAWRRVRATFAAAVLVVAMVACFVGGRLSDTSLSTAFVPPAPPLPSRVSPRVRPPLAPPHRAPLPTPGAVLISYR